LKLPVWLEAGSGAVVKGLWLGLLSEAELAALDERYYDAHAMYASPTWNERGLFEWERHMVETHFPDRGRIIVVAAGGGREVLALLEMGFDAVGYESHPTLAAFAETFLAERGHPGRVHLAPRDLFPPATGPCDGIVVGWGAYSLIHDRPRRVRFLEGARARLQHGGPVLLSFFERDADHRELRWTTTLANGLRRARRVPPAELGDTLAPNQVHVFTRAQLKEELTAARLAAEAYWTTSDADRPIHYGYMVARAT
jgi:hypothetical protein